MNQLLSAARGVVFFVYGFLFGDDWTVALVMLAALVLTGLLESQRVNAWWLVPPLAVLMTIVSLWRRRRAGP